MKRHALSALPLAAALLLPAAAEAQEGPVPEGPQVIEVQLYQWTMGFESVTVDGRTARFEIENVGDTIHAFELEGEVGGEEIEVVSAELEPGEGAIIIVSLPPGEYTVYCPIDRHRAFGMEATVTFTGGEQSE
jgi:uncharacterized cupredoxin-like copper-binding protein